MSSLIQTDRWIDTGRDIVASAMKQIATKTGQVSLLNNFSAFDVTIW